MEDLKADNINTIHGMFYNCINLNYLNIFNFNTKNAEYLDNILYDVGAEKKVDIQFNPNITNEKLIDRITKINGGNVIWKIF